MAHESDERPAEGGASAPDPGPADFKFKSDESWKEAARREKERLDEEAQEADRAGSRELPPASFLSLLNDLALQAMLALGMVGPEGEPLPYDLGAARYIIDTLGMLEEKTKGNLEAAEADQLQGVLAALRMRFVEVSREAGQPPPRGTIITDDAAGP